MATGVRSVVRQLGNKLIHTNNRGPTIVGRYGCIAINNHNYQGVPQSLPSYDSFEFHDTENIALKSRRRARKAAYLRGDLRIPRCRYGGIGPPIDTLHPMDDPRITTPARFAVDEFNKQEGGQLQFVRVVRASDQAYGSWKAYLLTLEAADAGAIKVYQALVLGPLHKRKEPMELKLFGLVVENGSLLKLFQTCSKPAELPIDNRV